MREKIHTLETGEEITFDENEVYITDMEDGHVLLKKEVAIAMANKILHNYRRGGEQYT